MCYDPWESSIYDFANYYLDAVRESVNPARTDGHRHIWSGRAEGFEAQYLNKLDELEDEELEGWLEDIESDFSGEERERLLEPAEKELKRRAEEKAAVG